MDVLVITENPEVTETRKRTGIHLSEAFIEANMPTA